MSDFLEQCIVCLASTGFRMHHALFQKNDLVKKNRDRYPDLTELMELEINKPSICHHCHTGNGSHITRKQSWEFIIQSGITVLAINKYLDKCERVAHDNGVILKFRRYYR